MVAITVDIMEVVMFIFTMRTILTTTIIRGTNRIPWQIIKPMVIITVTVHQRDNQEEHLLRTGHLPHHQPVSRVVHLLQTGHLQLLQPGSQVALLLQIALQQHHQPGNQAEFLLQIVRHLLQWEHPEPEVAEVIAEAVV